MLLSITSLALSIGGTEILHDVNLTLEEGEIYGLLGPNGAGKSTTIAAATGLLPRQRGEIRVFGLDPATDPEQVRGRLGVLPQTNGMYDWMTAPAYLRFFAELFGRIPTAAGIEECLATVGLEPRPGQPIGTFSHGMRQRLGLARALLPEPGLLILDEPTNGLDPRGRRDVHDVLLRLAEQQSVGILLCTHLIDDVERLCSKVGIIVSGRTVAEGELAELEGRSEAEPRYRIRLSREFHGTAAPAGIRLLRREDDSCVVALTPELEPEQAWRELLFAGWPIAEIQREGGGLEDLYLRLTEPTEKGRQQ